MRFIVKPSKFRRTPLLLKTSLGADKLVSVPGRYQPTLDYSQDLFLAFPKAIGYPNPIENVPESYEEISTFYRATKSGQRRMLLSSSLKTPEAYASSHYVVRPLHHFGGHDYRVTDNPNDYDPNTQYISPAFEKWREYRVLFIKGRPLITLRKKPGPNSDPFSAWNHTSGSYFQTVHQLEASPLSLTQFFADAANVCVLRDTHLIAADVLINRRFEYAVTEVNFAPAITIPANLEVIKNAFANS